MEYSKYLSNSLWQIIARWTDILCQNFVVCSVALHFPAGSRRNSHFYPLRPHIHLCRMKADRSIHFNWLNVQNGNIRQEKWKPSKCSTLGKVLEIFCIQFSIVSLFDVDVCWIFKNGFVLRIEQLLYGLWVSSFTSTCGRCVSSLWREKIRKNHWKWSDD